MGEVQPRSSRGTGNGEGEIGTESWKQENREEGTKHFLFAGHWETRRGHDADFSLQSIAGSVAAGRESSPELAILLIRRSPVYARGE
jgi:hypothetical protein